MSVTMYHRTTGSFWFRWLARIILISFAAASFILSFFTSLHGFHYVDAENAVDRIGPYTAIIFTLPLIIRAMVAWPRPRAGGLTAVIYSLAILAAAALDSNFYNHFTEIFYPLWGGALLGGIMHLFISKREHPIIQQNRLRRSAIIVSFLAPLSYAVIFLLVFVFMLPAGLGTGIFYTPWAIFIAVIAIIMPSLGGPLLVFSGSLLFSVALMADHYPQYYVPIASFSIVGGMLHLIWRYK
jgi:hypothetical protein